MESTDADRQSRSSAAELVLQVVWVVGAMAAYLAGAVMHALAAVGVLAAAFAVSLLLARVARGWSALPGMCAALMLQAPLLCGLGYYTVDRPLGHDPWPCFFWIGTDLQLVITIAFIVGLSSPIGFLLRLDRRAIHALRWFARGAAPVVGVALGALVVLGTLRLTRLPTPDHYFDSLPLHATIPRPQAQPCTPLENRQDPDHDPGYGRKICATPEVDARPLAFHYHAESYGDDHTFYSLHARSSSGHDRAVGVYDSDPPAVTVKRDEALGLWFVRGDDPEPSVLAADGRRRYRVALHALRTRIAPPMGWTLLGAAGLLVTLACLGASFGLGGLADARSEGRRAWLAARRGDLSLVALNVALCTGALLACALFTGFLL